MSDYTDRELLERAAKAAGIHPELVDAAPGRHFLRDGTSGESWNPLKSDADAFRLVVRLKTLGLWEDASRVEPQAIEGFWDGDPYAATRRAIVRAAAALSASSPNGRTE